MRITATGADSAMAGPQADRAAQAESSISVLAGPLAADRTTSHVSIAISIPAQAWGTLASELRCTDILVARSRQSRHEYNRHRAGMRYFQRN